MNNEKMAFLISESRKAKKLTQRELAELLNVTDKAVSKWERGLSCPDISLLTSLSDIFGISVGELLKGERDKESSVPEVKTIVESTLEYADRSVKTKFKNILSVIHATVSLLFLTAVITCIICNYAVSGSLTWAWYPISSILFSWLILLPIMILDKKGICISLAVFSILTIPFLYILEKIIGTADLIMPIGVKSSIIGIIYLWIVFLLFNKAKIRKYISVALALLLSIPVTAMINSVVDSCIGGSGPDIWDMLVYCILTSLTITVFFAGHIRHRKILK